MKNNVIIGIDDDYISIYVWTSFNNQVIPLFYNSISNQESIVNGSVYDRKQFCQILTNLVQQATKFIGEQINEVALSLHNFNVVIQDFELPIQLKNNLINQNIWETDIFPKLQIKRADDDQHLFAFDVVKWEINGKKLDVIDKDYQCEKMVIHGKKYLINKLIYENFVDALQECKLKLKSFHTTLDIYKSNQHKNEINILVGKNNVSIASISNQHLISNVVCTDKGFEQLAKLIHEKYALEYPTIYEYFKNINFFKSNPDVPIIDVCDDKLAKIKRISQNNMDEVINEYASSVLELVSHKLDYYKKEKNTCIDNVNLISNVPIIQQIFNLFHIHSKHQFNIIKPTSTMMYETRYIYCMLTANKFLKQTRMIN